MITTRQTDAGKAQSGQCRIISGKWRGRKIKFNGAEGLRPTTDRIRETVFNWLQTYLPNSYCLDCFAGSGVLGFEALSRGAEKVVFIEQNRITVDALIENARLLNTDDVDIITDDALHWLKANKERLGQAEKALVGKALVGKNRLDETLSDEALSNETRKFDLVFLDPPFQSDLLEEACVQLNHSGCLADDALIYVEHAVDTKYVVPENWICLKQKRAGQVDFKLFENQCSSER